MTATVTAMSTATAHVQHQPKQAPTSRSQVVRRVPAAGSVMVWVGIEASGKVQFRSAGAALRA
jgi:hypothetical protein